MQGTTGPLGLISYQLHLQGQGHVQCQEARGRDRGAGSREQGAGSREHLNACLLEPVQGVHTIRHFHPVTRGTEVQGLTLGAGSVSRYRG